MEMILIRVSIINNLINRLHSRHKLLEIVCHRLVQETGLIRMVVGLQALFK